MTASSEEPGTVPVSHLLAVFQLPLPVIHLMVAMRPSPGLGTGSFFRSHLHPPHKAEILGRRPLQSSVKLRPLALQVSPSRRALARAKLQIANERLRRPAGSISQPPMRRTQAEYA